MKFGDRLVAGVSSLAVRQVLEAASALLAAMILIRYFGPTRYGLLALAIAVAELAALATGTFEEAVRRYVPEYRAAGRFSAARRVVALALGTRLGLGAAVGLALYAGAGGVAAIYDLGDPFRNAVAAAALLLIPIGLNAVATSLLIALDRFRLIAVGSLAAALLTLLVAVLAPALQLSVAGFVLLSAGFQTAVAATLLALALPGLRVEEAIERAGVADGNAAEAARVWRYVWPLWGSAAAYTAYQQASRLLLGFFAPVAVVGYFSVAKNVVERLTGLYYQVPAALLPSLSERMEREGPESASRVVERLADWVLPLALLLAIAVLCLAPELVLLFGGEAFRPAIGLLAILSVQFLFRLPSSLWGTLYYLHERTRTLLWMNVARVGPLLLFLALAVPAWGGAGAAAAEAGSYAIALGLFVLHIPRSFDLRSGVVLGRTVRAALVLGLVAAIVLLTDWAPLARYALVLLAPLLIGAAGFVEPGQLRELRELPLDNRFARAVRGLLHAVLAAVLRVTGRGAVADGMR